jgi:hypothetical protein
VVGVVEREGGGGASKSGNERKKGVCVCAIERDRTRDPERKSIERERERVSGREWVRQVPLGPRGRDVGDEDARLAEAVEVQEAKVYVRAVQVRVVAPESCN